MHNIIVVQSNLDYPDSLRLDERARIIENMNIKANQTSFECSSSVTTHASAAFAFSKRNKLAFTSLFNAVLLKRLWRRISIMANKYSWQNWDQRKSPDNREIRIIEVWIIKVRLYLFWADNLFALFFNFLLPIPHFLPHPLRPPPAPRKQDRQTNKQQLQQHTYIYKTKQNREITEILGLSWVRKNTKITLKIILTTKNFFSEY